MFKKIANAYEKLIGKSTGAQFVEDVFANFFNNFFHKYKGVAIDRLLFVIVYFAIIDANLVEWTDNWNSPESQQARREATEKLWEKEEEKELEGGLRKHKVNLVVCQLT
jgi:hypothetical protein